MNTNQTVSKILEKSNDVIKTYYNSKEKRTANKAMQDMLILLHPLTMLRESMERSGENTKEISEVIMKMELISIQ